MLRGDVRDTLQNLGGGEVYLLVLSADVTECLECTEIELAHILLAIFNLNRRYLSAGQHSGTAARPSYRNTKVTSALPSAGNFIRPGHTFADPEIDLMSLMNCSI